MDDHVAGIALGDLERARLLAGAVDDAGDEARAAQPAARARAELGALLGLQRCAIGSHAAAEDSGAQEAQGFPSAVIPSSPQRRIAGGSQPVPSRIPATAGPAS